MRASVKRILVVDDDAELQKFLEKALKANGFLVRTVGSFAEAVRELEECSYTLVLLDNLLGEGMPGGLELLKYIRRTLWSRIPVIMLTALSGDDSCVRCLRCGADDYIVKPFGLAPLLARIEAVLRRTSIVEPVVPEAAAPARKITLDHERREVRLDSGECFRLTFREMEVLALLLSKRGDFVSLEELQHCIWGANATETEGRRVASTIHRLRRKLASHIEILNVYGGSYRII